MAARCGDVVGRPVKFGFDLGVLLNWRYGTPIFAYMYGFYVPAKVWPWGLVVLLSVAGCVWKGEHGGRRTADISSQEVWHCQPWRMRVYPSSRFTQEAENQILEARIELIDQMGDSVKGVGRFRIELFDRSQAGNPGIGQRLYSWDVSTMTLADQVQYYDPITRAYLFRLKLDDVYTARSQTVIQVMFISPEGKRLEAKTTLPIHLGSPWSSGMSN